MHFIVTGHTGFKGSWLLASLQHLGHSFTGIALDPAEDSLYDSLSLSELCAQDIRVDVSDRAALEDAMRGVSGDVLVHMAAQPLVSVGYSSPQLTYDTNLLGTINVLELAEKIPGLRSVIVVTTDKVYRWDNLRRAYLEGDCLGPLDPYGNSKALADLYAQAWFTRNEGFGGAVVRAGNVIGLGDRNLDRLIPSLQNAIDDSSHELELRMPHSVRPWQHVLDCIGAYLRLADATLARKVPSGKAWNIGPKNDSFLRVSEIVSMVEKLYEVEFKLSIRHGNKDTELDELRIDSKDFRSAMNWSEKISSTDAVRLSLLGPTDSGDSKLLATEVRRQIGQYFSP